MGIVTSELQKKIFKGFQIFEETIIVILSIVIIFIIILSVIRVFGQFYHILIDSVMKPQEVEFSDYQDLFGKLITVFISLEFLSSVLKILKRPQIKTLVQDVSLITALAIFRKLIIADYNKTDLDSYLVLGGLIIATGVFYFLVHKIGNKIFF